MCVACQLQRGHGCPQCNLHQSSVTRHSDEGQAGSPLRANAVLVNPEPKAHVRVEHQVSDSTTANASVFVSIAVGKLNEDNAEDRRNLKASNSVRGTRLDVEEHEMLSDVK